VHRSARFPNISLPFAMLVIVPLLLPALAHGGPTVGWLENWTSTVSNWGGGATGTTISNPGSGGVDDGGATPDGYLFIGSGASPVNLGARSNGSEYTGNWLAAGIGRVTFCLNDVGAANPLEIHLSIGNSNNLWQCNTGFHPLHQLWSGNEVDLTDSTNFTHTINSDGLGFAAALQDVQVVLIRHDVAPYSKTPDSIVGDYGVDRFELLGPSSPVARSSWSQIKRLYR